MRDMELYLVLVVDPYDEPSYGDIRCVCDRDHLRDIVGRLHDAGFASEDIRAVRCGVNERIDWNADMKRQLEES